MTSLLWKIGMSFAIDAEWIATPKNRYRWRYLVKKYLLIALPFLFWDKKTHAYAVTVWDRKIRIPTIEHIAFLQGICTDHAYLRHYIPQDATVIDIGAHIGEFALVSKQYLRAKQVFSFEPIRKTYDLLQLNTPFAAYHAAVGTEKEQDMYIGKNTVAASAFRASKQDILECSPCVSVDAIPEIAVLANIDLFKIDVEGMEYDVLLASKETLKKSSYILIELSLHRPATQQAMETIALLQDIVPGIQLIRVGTIFAQKKTSQQVAFDALFYNSKPL